MAKRRNPKKEKALRNQAYARKFRKRTTTGRMGRRFQQRPPKSEEEDTGAAAMDAADQYVWLNFTLSYSEFLGCTRVHPYLLSVVSCQLEERIEFLRSIKLTQNYQSLDTSGQR